MNRRGLFRFLGALPFVGVAGLLPERKVWMSFFPPKEISGMTPVSPTAVWREMLDAEMFTVMQYQEQHLWYSDDILEVATIKRKS